MQAWAPYHGAKNLSKSRLWITARRRGIQVPQEKAKNGLDFLGLI
jgi:hypothetical protein